MLISWIRSKNMSDVQLAGSMTLLIINPCTIIQISEPLTTDSLSADGKSWNTDAFDKHCVHKASLHKLPYSHSLLAITHSIMPHLMKYDIQCNNCHWHSHESKASDSAVGVDRLSAPILSIFTIIDIGHFQNRFTDIYFYFYLFCIMQTNILFTGDIIYWWINNTGEII